MTAINRKAEAAITAEYLRELLHYDPETGIFTWKVTRRGKARAGSVAGNLHPFGYARIQIDGVRYKSHRLAWLYIHGEFPTDQIDHINQRRDDNRLANLRAVTTKENQRNATMRITNTSGVVGVYWHKKGGKWLANIVVNGKNHHLGLFTDKVDAIAARKAAERKHGFHPNHGKPKKRIVSVTTNRDDGDRYG